MKKYLLSKELNTYKANLHCHSNISDGKLSPLELKKLYKENGYSVLAYTDHDILISHNELTDSDFVALNGFEAQFNGSNKYPGMWNEKKCHICFISGKQNMIKQPCWNEKYAYIGNCKEYIEKVQFDEESSPFKREYSPKSINEMISIARAKGFFVTYNHPNWSLENYEQYTKYEGINAVEVYNYSTEKMGFQSTATYAYDDILRTGKKVFAVASDDNHNLKREDSFGGFVMIKAKELNYDAIMQALFSGDFYASTGPEFYEIYIEDDKLHISCSNVCSINLTTEGRDAQCVSHQNGNTINKAIIPLDLDCKYFRISIKDAFGNYAYTNAFFVGDL